MGRFFSRTCKCMSITSLSSPHFNDTVKGNLLHFLTLNTYSCVPFTIAVSCKWYERFVVFSISPHYSIQG